MAVVFILTASPGFYALPLHSLFRSLAAVGSQPCQEWIGPVAHGGGELLDLFAALRGNARMVAQGHSDSAMALRQDRKSTRLNSSHQIISYAVFCLKKKSGRGDDVLY